MGFKKGENPYHPRKGSAIRVDPIRDLQAIARIKAYLINQNKIRDLCLFTMGINTAWRANELVAVRVGQVLYLSADNVLELKQSKTEKYRRTPLNSVTRKAILLWLRTYEAQYPNYFGVDAPLFPSRRKGTLQVPSLTALVKKWCTGAEVPGNFGSHTMRKTWAYHQRATFHSPLPLIMQALGHTSEKQTLAYIGILSSEIESLYRHEL